MTVPPQAELALGLDLAIALWTCCRATRWLLNVGDGRGWGRVALRCRLAHGELCGRRGGAARVGGHPRDARTRRRRRRGLSAASAEAAPTRRRLSTEDRPNAKVQLLDVEMRRVEVGRAAEVLEPLRQFLVVRMLFVCQRIEQRLVPPDGLAVVRRCGSPAMASSPSSTWNSPRNRSPSGQAPRLNSCR